MYICSMVITKENFRYEREKRNLSREEFGKLLGISAQSIQLKELGKRGITLKDKILIRNLDTLIEQNKTN